MENSVSARRPLPDPLSTKVTLGGEEIDLEKMPLLTLGHKRRLWKEHQVDLSNIGRFTPEDEFRFALFMIRQVRPATTEQEVEAIPMSSVADIALIAVKRLTSGVSLPFSASSPTSPGGGDGGQAT